MTMQLQIIVVSVYAKLLTLDIDNYIIHDYCATSVEAPSEDIHRFSLAWFVHPDMI
jgi:hypothetical protein